MVYVNDNIIRLKQFGYLLLLLTPALFSEQFTDPVMLPKSLYFQGVTALLVVLLGVLFLINNKPHYRLQFNFIDLSFVLWGVYQLFYLHHIGQPPTLMQLNGLALLVMYVFGRLKPFLSHIFVQVAVWVAGMEALFGLYNAFGVNGSGKLVGHWLNDGIYAIYLAAVLPAVLFLVLKPRKSGCFRHLSLRYVNLLILVLLMAVLLMGSSRSAWLGGAGGSLFILFTYMREKKFFPLELKRWQHLVWIVPTIALLVPLASWLYTVKEGSTLGRIYIYQHALAIWKNHPLFGVGPDRFLTAMNDQQVVNYDPTKPLNELSYSAEKIEYAFNEFLHLATEQGIFGLFFLLTAVVLILSIWNKMISKAQYIPFFGIFLSVLISSQFSYPLHDAAIAALFYISLGVLASVQRPIAYWSLSGIRKVLILPLIVLLGCFLVDRIKFTQASMKWKSAYVTLRNGEIENAMKTYDSIYPILKNDRYFLFNYGAELCRLGYHEKSQTILKEAEKQLNDEDVALYMAENYREIGDVENTEKYLLRARNLVPYRFSTRAKLVQFYEDIFDRKKATAMAKETVALKPKFDQPEVKKIKDDLQSYLDEIKSQENK